METPYFFAFSGVIAVICLAFALVSLAFWARLSALEDTLKLVEEKVPSKRLAEVEASSDALLARMDNVVVDISVFKNQVHKELQRFDQIMRRMEKAARTVAKGPEEEDTEEDGFPDEVKPEENSKTAKTRMTRAELRKLWSEKHGG